MNVIKLNSNSEALQLLIRMDLRERKEENMEVHVSMYDKTPYCVTSHSHEMMCFGCITFDGQQR